MSSVLTRAARRKANLSPPPPLFPNAKSSVPSASVCAKTDARVSVRNTNSSSSDSEGEVALKLWVQCDHCHKWRVLPRNEVIESHQEWNCTLHPDPSMRSCIHPQEHCKREQYVFSQLEVGQLVWAKMTGFCPWPAIITPDLWGEDHMNKDEGSIYHVEFLGRPRTHSWLAENKVEPFKLNECSLGSIASKTKKLERALEEAEYLSTLPTDKILESCVFTELNEAQTSCKIIKQKKLSQTLAQQFLHHEMAQKPKLPTKLPAQFSDEVNVEKILASLFPNIPSNQFMKSSYNKDNCTCKKVSTHSMAGNRKKSSKHNQSTVAPPAALEPVKTKTKIISNKQQIAKSKAKCKLKFVSQRTSRPPLTAKVQGIQDGENEGNGLNTSQTFEISLQRSAMDSIIEAEEEAQKELKMIENMLGLAEDDTNGKENGGDLNGPVQISTCMERTDRDKETPPRQLTMLGKSTNILDVSTKGGIEVEEDNWICSLMDSIDTLDGQIQDFTS